MTARRPWPEGGRSDLCNRRARWGVRRHEVAGLWRSLAGRRYPGLVALQA